MAVKRKTGRPKKDPVDKYRAQALFNKVSENKERTGYAIEFEFSPENFKKDADGNTTYPGTWRKYRAGKTTPSANALSKIEESYPGSLYWFNHPVWDLLADKLPKPELLKAFIAPAKSRLTKVVGEYNPNVCTRILTNENTYNYFFKFDPVKRLSRRSERDSIDKLIGALALLIDAEIRESRIQYEYSYKAVMYNLPTACRYMPYITEEMLLERISVRFLPPKSFLS